MKTLPITVGTILIAALALAFGSTIQYGDICNTNKLMGAKLAPTSTVELASVSYDLIKDSKVIDHAKTNTEFAAEFDTIVYTSEAPRSFLGALNILYNRIIV